MYVVTSMPLVSRTRATLRSAEFGFLGVWVKTRTHTPRFCGLFCRAGLLVLLTIFLRPARTSCEIVGIWWLSKKSEVRSRKPEGRAAARTSHFKRQTSCVSGLKTANGLAPENPTE